MKLSKKNDAVKFNRNVVNKNEYKLVTNSMSFGDIAIAPVWIEKRKKGKLIYNRKELRPVFVLSATNDTVKYFVILGKDELNDKYKDKPGFIYVKSSLLNKESYIKCFSPKSSKRVFEFPYINKLNREFLKDSNGNLQLHTQVSNSFGVFEQSVRLQVKEQIKQSKVRNNLDEHYLKEEIKVNDNLNPDLWEGEELKEDVKEHLLDITDAFLDKLKEDNIELALVDVRLLGSNANYNYNDKSDIDLHLVADMSASSDCNPIYLERLYDAYRSLFNKKYNINIKGHEVEIYVEDVNKPAKSNGVYSLYTGWVSKPDRKQIPEIDWEEFEKVFKEYEDKYFAIMKEVKYEPKDNLEESYDAPEYNIELNPITVDYINSKLKNADIEYCHIIDGYSSKECIVDERFSKKKLPNIDLNGNFEKNIAYSYDYGRKNIDNIFKLLYFLKGTKAEKSGKNRAYNLGPGTFIITKSKSLKELADNLENLNAYVDKKIKILYKYLDYKNSWYSDEVVDWLNRHWKEIEFTVPESQYYYFIDRFDRYIEDESSVHVLVNKWGIAAKIILDVDYDNEEDPAPSTLVTMSHIDMNKNEYDSGFSTNNKKHFVVTPFIVGLLERYPEDFWIGHRNLNESLKEELEMSNEYCELEESSSFKRSFDDFLKDAQVVLVDDARTFDINRWEQGLEDEINEELLTEAKVDIDNFINKFGEDTYNNFLKAKDRLKQKGYSTDITYYFKNFEKDKLIDLLASLYDEEKDSQKQRIIKGTDKEIRGKYNYLGEKDGYKVYQPLDYIASMDLGVNTGWCTTGRYGHYGHPEYTPSESDAKKHWNDYTSKGIKFYYFLDSKTMYGKYALALYSRILNVNKKVTPNYFLNKTNFELFNDEDVLDYSMINNLPLDLIKEKVELDFEELNVKSKTIKLNSGKEAYLVIYNKNPLVIGLECETPRTIWEDRYNTLYTWYEKEVPDKLKKYLKKENLHNLCCENLFDKLESWMKPAEDKSRAFRLSYFPNVVRAEECKERQYYYLYWLDNAHSGDSGSACFVYGGSGRVSDDGVMDDLIVRPTFFNVNSEILKEFNIS